ncbi:hypothetical protein K1719_004403 [Acacia pycnantha]|nr:hypothetical protein K1719_004403 [Acacia pycnantha]
MGMRILLKCFGGSSSSFSTKQPSTSVEYLCHRFSLSKLRKSTHDFDKSLVIGEGPYVSVVEKVRNVAATGNGKGIIDERLVGKIEAECWKLYMDITECYLSEDSNERLDMGDVELQLEHVLQLQEELKQMPNQAPHALFI